MAEKTLDKYQLCDCCLGRLFRQIETGSRNNQKGELIRNNLEYGEKTIVGDCWLCEGLLDEIGHFANLVSEAIQEYEFDTFLIGSKIDESGAKGIPLHSHLRILQAPDFSIIVYPVSSAWRSAIDIMTRSRALSIPSALRFLSIWAIISWACLMGSASRSHLPPYSSSNSLEI